MLRVGLTGGIGAGKSTVAARFTALGALVVDADRIARDVVEPGTPGLTQIVDRFGPGVRAREGNLDRTALAAIVFSDKAARADLEAITHPLIAERTQEMMARAVAGQIVVHDVPLLVEKRMGPAYHLVVVVDASREVRLRRLVGRGLSQADAVARMDHQATHDERVAAADVLLDNEGSEAELVEQVDRLWALRLRPYEDNLIAGVRTRRSDVPEIDPADPAWRLAAARLARRIRWAFERAGAGDLLLGIDHIGSTAVADLAAKGVVDLQIRVRDLADADRPEFVAAMREAGYLLSADNDSDTVHPWAPDQGEWAKRFYGGMDPGQIVHVHVRRHLSANAATALLFRDWLRANPIERQAYEEAKWALAAQVGHAGGTTADYTDAKEPWIASALHRAREWAEQTRWRGPTDVPRR